MTSRHDKHGRSMSQLLEGAEGSPDEIVEMILLEINKMFEDKRVVVRRKIEALHDAFDRFVKR
jgi:hypothetical protein